MLRTSRLTAVYRGRFLRPVASFCLRSGIGETHLSIAAFISAIASAVLFVVEPWIGGVTVLFSGWLDTLDGEVSRARGMESPAGAFLDSVLDRGADFVVLLGVLGFYHRAGLSSLALVTVLMLLAFGCLMVSYTQARAEGLGSSCSVGFFERPERVLVLSGGAIVGSAIDLPFSVSGLPLLDRRPLMGLALVALAAGTNVTAARRLLYGYRKMTRELK